MVDLHYLALPLAIFFITLILIIKSATTRAAKLPAGPWKLPLIGNMHQLRGDLHHRILHKLSLRYGPIMSLRLGQVEHIVISTPESAREILKTHDLNFCSRAPLIASTIVFYDNQDIGFSPFGAYWRQLRKICVLELLSPRKVKSFNPIREAENVALIKSISTSGTKLQVNLTEKLMLLTSTTVSHAAFGQECKNGPKFISEVKKLMKIMNRFNVADFFPSLSFLGKLLGTSTELELIHRQIDGNLNEIIKDHESRKSSREHGKEDEDLVDVLLRLKDEGGLEFPLSMTHVKAVILDIFIGGSDTTGNSLIWVMAELMRNPRMLAKAQDEVRQVAEGKETIEEEGVEKLRYMKLVIKESLRLHPGSPLSLPRVCREKCTLGSFEIPEGTRVLTNLWAIARDPRYWDDAESFKPERFEGVSVAFTGESFHYLPFGGGRRVCPGIGFALTTIELTLAKLLYHFEWELPNGMEPEDLDMTETSGPCTIKNSGLSLIATPWFPQPLAAP